MTKKSMIQKKRKTAKLDFTKTKNFYTSNDTIKNMDKPQIGRKISAKHICNKGLVSRIYSELLQLNNRTTQPKLDRF